MTSRIPGYNLSEHKTLNIFMQYKNIHRIEKNQEHSRTKGGKTHFFKNNSRTNKIQEYSRTFKDFKDQWLP